MSTNDQLEQQVCKPVPLNKNGFNPDAKIPYGCTVDHIASAMQEFLDFIEFINSQMNTRNIPRLESFIMPANFSSMVGEFMVATIPKYCSTVLKNRYHNGHPDIIPSGYYENDSVLHGAEGIEVKGSRQKSGWQGHNPEDIWLMVFVFDSNTSNDSIKGIGPKPFKFVKVVGAYLNQDDWKFSGRSSTSRRTITASVTKSGAKKMESNWIYRHEPQKNL